MVSLVISGLRKSYGNVVALDGVDLEIIPGEILGLLGPNGAGKTTLVSIVAGLRRPDAGEVRVAGIDAVSRPQQARRHLGFAPQELGIYPSITVRENLLLFGQLVGLKGNELDRRIAAVSEAFALGELLQRLARFLSGGEKRRLHSAAALLGRPPLLLLLDEPTSGVDVATRSAILEVVRGLAREGSAVCYSTHYLPEVEALGASVAILDRGQIIVRDSLSALIDSHGNSAVELRFDGPAPSCDGLEGAERLGDIIRIRTDGPAASAAAAIGALALEATRLRSLEIVRPSLEAVFLSLTGRRYDGSGIGTGEADVT